MHFRMKKLYNLDEFTIFNKKYLLIEWDWADAKNMNKHKVSWKKKSISDSKNANCWYFNFFHSTYFTTASKSMHSQIHVITRTNKNELFHRGQGQQNCFNNDKSIIHMYDFRVFSRKLSQKQFLVDRRAFCYQSKKNRLTLSRIWA